MNEEKNIAPKKSLFHRIVNYFLYALIGIFLLLVIVFGISQTSTFRNYLREEIVSIVNEEINGRLNLENLEGTLLTSLILRNGSLTFEKDTVISFSLLEVKVSPLQMFLKKIYIRKVELFDLNFNLLSDANGEFNISKIFPSSEEDTTKSDFGFAIVVNEFNLFNGNFVLQSFENLGGEKIYRELNFDDLRVQNINIQLSANILLKREEYSLNLISASLNPNVEEFYIHQLAAMINFSGAGFDLQNLQFRSERSDFELSAKLDYNFFEEWNSENFSKAPVKGFLKAVDFHFDDLSAIVPATSILKGSLGGDIYFEGILGDVFFPIIKLEYRNTELNASGYIKNFNNPSNLLFDLTLIDSKLFQPDISRLLPSVGIPKFRELGTIRIDTLTYVGEPVNFKSRIAADIKGGGLNADFVFDLSGDELKYDLDATTSNINLKHLLSYPTLLNSNIKLNGIGSDIYSMNMNLNAVATSSFLGDKKVDELKLDLKVEDGKIESMLDALCGAEEIESHAELLLKNDEEPNYNFSARFKGVNFGPFFMDSSFTTFLNTEIEAEGKSFDIEKLSGALKINIKNSKLFDKSFTDLSIDLKTKSNGDGNKEIRLESNLASAYVKGKFKYSEITSQLANEINLLTDLVSEKVEQYYPSDKKEETTKLLNKKTKFAQSNFPFSLEYEIELKSLAVLSYFFEESFLEAEGKFKGKIVNDENGFKTLLNSNVDFLRYWGTEDAYFTTDAIFDFSLSHKPEFGSLSGIDLKLDATADRVYLGTDMTKIDASLALANNVLNLDGAANINGNMKTNFASTVDLSSPVAKIEIDKLEFAYDKFELASKVKSSILYSDGKIDIKNFNLERGNSKIFVNGTIAEEGKQQLKLELTNFKGYDISYSLLDMSATDVIDNDLNLTAMLEGTFDNPLITIDFTAENNTYKSKNFGSLKSKLSYFNKKLNTDIVFIDEQTSYEPSLKIFGTVPIDLSLSASGKRLIEDQPYDLHMLSNNFNLGAFGNVLPFIDNLNGILETDISITGTLNELKQNGYFTLRDASFLVEQNNLSYSAGVVLRMDNDQLFVDSLLLQNLGNVKNIGSIKGRGKFKLKGFAFESAQLLLNGDLTVLSNDSKKSNPAVYGNLFVGTEGDIIFAINEQHTYLKVPLIVKEANLVFPPTQSGFASNAGNIIYRYVEHEKYLTEREKEIERLISISNKNNLESTDEKKSFVNFDYELSIKVKEEATMTFVFAREANQRLVTSIKGDLSYAQKGQFQSAQGELTLLEGSTLEFIKSFQATGFIRFESSLTDPYLNITALYKDYYILPQDSVSGKEEDVAIKVKLMGPLSQLSKNFAQNENNLAVFIGSQNIIDDKPDPTKDKADAIWFILTGKFTKDLTQSEKSEAAGQSGIFTGTATSIASSLLGGLLNQYFGDYVKSFEIRSIGTNTKFNLSGRYKDIRYSIGGTTDVFQDFSTANIYLEYNIIENFLIRLERKEAISEAKSYSGEMINELGLKYRIQF